MNIPRRSAAGVLLGCFLLTGCGSDDDGDAGRLTAPGVVVPTIRGVYSGATFWTFEAFRFADNTGFSWNCSGRVTVLRQTGTDFLGNFTVMPPESARCASTTGNVSAGVIRGDGGISFATSVTGQAGDEFFALPGCVVESQDPVWAGRLIGDRFVASLGLIVNCPVEGRLQVTGRADGPRTEAF